jgi:hypothetical protein
LEWLDEVGNQWDRDPDAGEVNGVPAGEDENSDEDGGVMENNTDEGPIGE